MKSSPKTSGTKSTSSKAASSEASTAEAAKSSEDSAKAKVQREWHLRNVVETTKGRGEIRELFLALKKPKKSAAKVEEAAPELPLSEMIDAILAAEFPS
jgi:hypothetical protein